MSLFEVIAAAVVGAALLWLVVQPLVAPTPATPDAFDAPDPEETPRGQALLALKEIDFDRATGKLSDADYDVLHARYTAAAIDVLGDGPTSGHRAVAIRSAAPGTSAPSTAASVAVSVDPALPRRCMVHGARTEPGALFCAECGLGLVTADGVCVACATAVPADARFCPGCGVPVSA